MATSTFLSNATVNITQGMTTTDLSDQCRSVTITTGFDPLESTAMGDTGHRFESATNPEYVITNCMLENFTPIASTVGELAMVTATFTGGTWVRDVT
jgi:hypothetical protein